MVYAIVSHSNSGYKGNVTVFDFVMLPGFQAELWHSVLAL